MGNLEPFVLVILEWRNPCDHPTLHMVKQQKGGHPSQQGQQPTRSQIAGGAGGGVEKQYESGEQQERCAEVALVYEDHDADAPSRQEWYQLSRLWKAEWPDLTVCLAQRPLVVGEVSGHEGDQPEFRQLGRLELHPGDTKVEYHPET